MPSVPWSTQINFASALLLHSCVTILLKEMLNWLEIVRRLLARRFGARRKIRASSTTSASQDSAITDAYTSFFSGDIDGEMAELYFTNTGVALLAVSLTSSVVMNLFLPTDALNIIVACTFGLAWAVSLAVVRTTYHHTFPIMALRRAGRFIWSDTPFVNFFSLIYIATVLKGRSTLRLQDYVTFRSIAVLELVFMKAKLASARPESQITLMRTLIRSERVILHADQKNHPSSQILPILCRKDIQAFTTSQRLWVMFCKTSIGHEFGCVTGELGPAKLPLPKVGIAIEDSARGWKLCRVSEDIMVLADCLAESRPKDWWSRQILAPMHGVLLRRLGKKRVVYFVRQVPEDDAQEPSWHSNVNLVTGVDVAWLEGKFELGQTRSFCALV